uniref:Bone morphogenetic protein 3 n=1 Tax=Lepisosteus oculatus TaxID=7918 RepID=W5M8I6_LEPOC|nr:PREDICTED: growth/differentiation factor 10 isoform X1 [Lepisosteus oculatus]
MALNVALLSRVVLLLGYSNLGVADAGVTPGSVQDSSVFAAPAERPSDTAALDSSAQDMVALHMFRLYEKYNREVTRPRDGNTVRSFKASPALTEQRVLYHFNLSSLQESEVVLATTFHFSFDKRPRQRSWACKRVKTSSCRLQQLHPLPPVNIVFRSAPSDGAPGAPLGSFAFYPSRRGAWQLKDITPLIKDATETGELVITAEFDFGQKSQKSQDRVSPSDLPYMLVYANDLAISEPNSVAMSLQRYDPSSAAEEATRSPNASPDARVKREADFPDPIRNNELPEVEYHTFQKHGLWESAYLALKPKPPKKDRRRKAQENSEGSAKSQVLSFDEKTMKKARRRQGNEPRICSRRYLKVDFADIGWSEWILSPKSFDAYYCAGACEFPMPKVVRPSNHATIQSIVKAVGIIAGIPEPCCVPDKMNSLSVLFLDENKNVVLKIYPNMSVETCACR